MKIGVLALQGAFVEHIEALEKLNIEAIKIRYESDLNLINGLIIPGGESTTIGKLLVDQGIKNTLMERIRKGLPVWGTCAGMILLAKKIVNQTTTHMPLMNIKVKRNAYGRQLGSFQTETFIEGLEGGPYPMVFIRAPYIEKIGDEVSILAKVDGKIVAAKEKNILVTSFHPELSNDLRMHEYFTNNMI